MTCAKSHTSVTDLRLELLALNVYVLSSQCGIMVEKESLRGQRVVSLILVWKCPCYSCFQHCMYWSSHKGIQKPWMGFSSWWGFQTLCMVFLYGLWFISSFALSFLRYLFRLQVQSQKTNTKGKQPIYSRCVLGNVNGEGKKTESERRASVFKPPLTEKLLFTERRKFLQRLTIALTHSSLRLKLMYKR